MKCATFLVFALESDDSIPYSIPKQFKFGQFVYFSLCPLTSNKEIYVIVYIYHPPLPMVREGFTLLVGCQSRRKTGRDVSCLRHTQCFWAPSWRTVGLGTILWT